MAGSAHDSILETLRAERPKLHIRIIITLDGQYVASQKELNQLFGGTPHIRSVGKPMRAAGYPIGMASLLIVRQPHRATFNSGQRFKRFAVKRADQSIKRIEFFGAAGMRSDIGKLIGRAENGYLIFDDSVDPGRREMVAIQMGEAESLDVAHGHFNPFMRPDAVRGPIPASRRNIPAGVRISEQFPVDPLASTDSSSDIHAPPS